MRQEFEDVPRILADLQSLVFRDGCYLLDIPSWPTEVDALVSQGLLSVLLATGRAAADLDFHNIELEESLWRKSSRGCWSGGTPTW